MRHKVFSSFMDILKFIKTRINIDTYGMLNDSTSVIHVPEQIVHTHFILRFLSLFDYKQ